MPSLTTDTSTTTTTTTTLPVIPLPFTRSSLTPTTRKTFTLIPIQSDNSTKTTTPTPTTYPLVLLLHNNTLHCLESTCPHSNGPLQIGDIEDTSLICPWHSFDFNLQTGKCTTDDRFWVRTFRVLETNNSLALEISQTVISENPGITKYEIASISEIQHPCSTEVINNITKGIETIAIEKPDHESMELPPAPDSLIEHALLILKTPNAILKTRLTLRMAELWNSNRIPFIIPDKLNSYNTILAQIPSLPPRDDIEIVNVFETSRRGKGGSLQSRVVMLHSLAGVEQWAIDLACDVVVRFAGSKIRGLPVGEEEDIVEEDGEMMDGMKKCKFCRGGYKLVKTLEEGEVVVDDEARVRVELERGFFDDFVRIASEEAKHFTFLKDRLEALGSFYGAHPIHSSLWSSATETSYSLLCRLGIVNMVHEARGLDVNPRTITRFANAGDEASREKLQLIHDDEIGHVSIGQRWFSWVCEVNGLDKYEAFGEIVKTHYRGFLKPPFNEADRLKAGIDERYYLPLADTKM